MDTPKMKMMTIRIDGINKIVPVYDLLPNGKCSNCKHIFMWNEGGWVTVDSDVHKMHGNQHFYKCPRCKNFTVKTN